MAVPGETSCRPVAPCQPGWDGIPTDGTTQFVDAGYTGGTSDGSETSPWTTISEALQAVASGGQVAIAAGNYLEDVTLSQPVRLVGACPDDVTLTGTGGVYATLTITGSGSGSEVRALAITGPGAAFVFLGDGSSWTLDAQLDQRSAAATGDHFGKSVAIDGKRIVVGAWGRDRTDGLESFLDEGEAFAFGLKDGAWRMENQVWVDGFI